MVSVWVGVLAVPLYYDNGFFVASRMVSLVYNVLITSYFLPLSFTACPYFLPLSLITSYN